MHFHCLRNVHVFENRTSRISSTVRFKTMKYIRNDLYYHANKICIEQVTKNQQFRESYNDPIKRQKRKIFQISSKNTKSYIFMLHLFALLLILDEFDFKTRISFEFI